MNVSHVILYILLIIISLVVFYNVNHRDMVYVRADIDNSYYMVQNRNNKRHAANLLANIKKQIFAISDHLMVKIRNEDNKDRYSAYIPYIEQLNKNIQNIIIKESAYNSTYTSYTVNKGEQMVLCIRSGLITTALETKKMHVQII